MTEPRMNSEIQDDNAFIREVLGLCSAANKEQALISLRNWEKQRYELKRSEASVANAISTVPPATGANSRQIGGAHYAAKIQHWDIVARYGFGYLEGCATKYVTRARKKNGAQDLEKAIHYVDKLIEMHVSESRVQPPRGPAPVVSILEFIQLNELTALEGAICFLLFTWRTVEDLDRVKELISVLIRQVRPAQSAATGTN